jgi:hypothetical protein
MEEIVVTGKRGGGGTGPATLAALSLRTPQGRAAGLALLGTGSILVVWMHMSPSMQRFRLPESRDRGELINLSSSSSNIDGDSNSESSDIGSSGGTGKEAQREKRRKSALKDKPAGTKPIDKDPRARGKIHDIKPVIGAAPDDWVGVTPSGDIVTTSPENGGTVWTGENVNNY